MHPLRQSRRRAAFRVLAPLLALAAGACEGTSEPGGVEGSYSVHSVNGRRPPTAVRGDPSGTLQVVDARLELDAPNAVVELTTRPVSSSGTAGAQTTTTYGGTYQASGDLITFSDLTTDQAGFRVHTEGVVISPREVAVTLHIPGPTYMGYHTYPVALILRR